MTYVYLKRKRQPVPSGPELSGEYVDAHDAINVADHGAGDITHVITVEVGDDHPPVVSLYPVITKTTYDLGDSLYPVITKTTYDLGDEEDM